MLDHYVYGCVERISPEAPVPVVKFQEEKFVPGGAGNVIANLAGLGISVCALGRLGIDIYGKKYKGKALYEVLEAYVRKAFVAIDENEREN